MKSMKGKGRFGILRGCSGKKNERCGLLSLPDDVFVEILAKLPRLDLVAIAMVSRRHRYVARSHKLWLMRYGEDSVYSYMYVYMHMYPDPSPGWFVFHPVQRRLKRIQPSLCPPPAPLEGSCFVTMDSGIYTIGGLMDGKPTSEVTFFDCINHKVYCVAPMKMARSGASACVVKDGKKGKVYVFGGCWDDVAADSSNWVEVYDVETRTWELLSVSTPKMPLKIKESVAIIDEKHVYAVDEDGELFIFSTSECKLWRGVTKEFNPENKNHWRLFNQTLYCRGIRGRILWRSPSDLDWKPVKGLEELQQQHIITFCDFNVDRMAILWSQGPPAYQTLELWFAEVSLEARWEGEEWEVWGNIEWSGAVFSDSSYTAFNLLYADSIYV